MDKTRLLELKNVDFSKVEREIMFQFKRVSMTSENYFSFFYAVYILYILQKEKMKPYKSNWENSKIIPNDEKNDAILSMGHVWNVIEESYGKFSQDELLACMLFSDGAKFMKNTSMIATTSSFLSKLSSEMLDIKKDETLLELCSGTGCFLTECLCKTSGLKYTGIDVNYRALAVARIKAILMECKADLSINNAITFRTEEKYDKVFVDYPLGVRLGVCNKEELQIIDKMQIKHATNNADWLFILSAVEQLNETGKAVTFIPSGRLRNQVDKIFRQYFVENGYVEAVVTLPAFTKFGIQIPISMLVLSMNNDEIRFTDASSVLSKIGSFNYSIDDIVTHVLGMTDHDAKETVVVSKDKIAEEGYTLNPIIYLMNRGEKANQIDLGKALKGIKRGCQASPKRFEELRSNVPTAMRYVSVKDINDGSISNIEPFYLKEIPAELERFCVKNGDILLSKIGYPDIKAAVASLSEGEEIVVNSNIIILDIDEEKINPYYILAYLVSDKGKAMMKGICTGTNIPMMSIESIRKMPIPVLERQTQDKIGTIFAAGVDEIAILNRRLERTRSELTHIFDEEA